MKKWGGLVVLLCVLWGCSSDDVVTIPPAPLPAIHEEVSLDTLWSVSVGNGLGEKFTRIRPVVADGTVFVASIDGVIAAYDSLSGGKRWQVDIKTPISGGVGAGENKIFVGTLNGDLVALSTEDGSTLWSTPVSSEVLSIPQVDHGVVVVQSNDDVVTALDVNDGTQRWQYNDNTPSLTVRGTASPLISGTNVYVGLASGRVAVISMANGGLLWDRPISSGEGRTELDRLNDVDGTPILNQGSLFVGNYQGNLLALNTQTSEIKWQNELSTLLASAADDGNVYVTNADSDVLAFDQASGSPVWSVKDLERRSLTAPEVFNGYIAAADFEGYVHLLSADDGRFVGRARADSSGVRVQPLAVDGVLYVYGNSGKLVAYRMAPK